MADDLDGESIAERRHALRLFTDRLQERRRFACYVNGTPTPGRVLYFHGDGGNGKSLLLDLLRTRYCFQLAADKWADISRLEGEAFVEAFEGSNKYRVVPCAHLDFGIEPRGNDNPLEDVSALSMLRRQLAKEGFRFPLFDYGLVLQLRRTGRLSKGRLDEFFGSAGIDFAVEVLSSIEALTGMQLIVKLARLLGAQIDEDFTLYLKRRGLSADIISELAELDPLRELPLVLPDLLAADLADSLRRARVPHERVVLMFDTHEKFWGSLGRREGPTQFHQRDVWLRRLLLALDQSAGIIAVVAGRDPPRWSNAVECPIPSECVDLQLVGHLEEADARHYLHLGGIEDTALQGALLHLAEVTPDQYHPLYTGLCGDIVLAARRQGVELTPEHFAEGIATQSTDLKAHGRELLHRLLKWCDAETVDAVEVLSACRSFDEKLFAELGRALNFASTHAAFMQVAAFSFVWPQDGERATFRIHDLMRRVLRESKSERVLQAHHAVAALYRERAAVGDATAELEALYHRFQVDAVGAGKEWNALFHRASSNADYPLADALMALQTQVRFAEAKAEGWAWVQAAGMLRTLSRYQAAREALENAVRVAESDVVASPDDARAWTNKGAALVSLGDLQAEVAEHEAARESYRLAIETCERALTHAPEDVRAWNIKGAALANLAVLQAGLAEYEAARASYALAIEAYDRALAREPEYDDAWNNKSTTLRSFADLQAGLAEHEVARASYGLAIEAYDEMLSRAPEDVESWVNKGDALRRLADLQARLAEHEAARASYGLAIEAYGRAHAVAPEHVDAWTGKGGALGGLADLLAGLGEREAARASYGLAIEAYGRALARATEDVETWVNNGTALASLADLQAGLAEHEAARASYGLAIEAYDLALARAPENVGTWTNKGLVLANLADLQAGLAEYEAARASYGLAIGVYDRVLARAPKYVDAWNNKGCALTSLADLQAELAEHETARASYGLAIEAYDRALTRAPEDIRAWNNKGWALTRLADLQAGLAEHEAARASYGLAIEAYDRGLARAPEEVRAWTNKGNALQQLGALQAGLAEHERARASYSLAIEAYERALARAPEYLDAWANKGTSLRRFADLQAGLAEHEAARASYGRAIAAYDRALTCAPESVATWVNKGNALQGLAAEQAAQAEHEAARASYGLSIEAYDHVLERVPEYVDAWNNKGIALTDLAALQAELAEHEAACVSYGLAIEIYARAIAHAPENVDIWANKGNALRALAALQASRGQHEPACELCRCALESYDAGLSIAADSVDLLQSRSAGHLLMGDLIGVANEVLDEQRIWWEKAESDCKRALVLARANPELIALQQTIRKRTNQCE